MKKKIEVVYLVYEGEDNNECFGVSCIFKQRKNAQKYIRIENAFDVKRFGEIKRFRRISTRRICDGLYDEVVVRNI
jgi:hypothetical protein